MKLVKLVIPLMGLFGIIAGASFVLVITGIVHDNSTVVKTFKISSDKASVSCTKYASGELVCKEVK